MSSATAERTTSRYRTRLAIEIVALSLALPLVVIVWSATTALKDKLVWGRPSNVLKLHHTGSVRNGELWFTEAQLDDNPTATAKQSRIKRLDLQTGVERDTGLVDAGDFAHPKWLGDKLYLVASNAIYEAVGDSVIPLTASLPDRPNSHSLLFLYDDRLTTVHRLPDGRHCLSHLIDGQWKNGRPILLPGPAPVWHDDQQRNHKVLLPRSSLQPIRVNSDQCGLWVVQHKSQYHLMLTNYFRGFAAYRTGFEFADVESDCASAIAPENAITEVSAWEPIGPNKTAADSWIQMASTSDGLLFVSHSAPSRLVRRTTEGCWEELVFPNDMLHTAGDLLPNTSRPTTYVINADATWGSARVRRLEGDTVQPVHLVVPGCESEYVGRWRTLAWGVLFAWLLHIAVLIAGAGWLARDGSSEMYEFGVEQALLASVWRRAVATTVDVTLMLVVLSLLWLLCCWVFGFKHVPFHGAMEADSLLRIEGWLAGGPRYFKYIPETLLGSPIGWLVHPFAVGRDFPSLWVAALFVAGSLKVLFEGRIGVTPGKWLLGIRTVSSTLRPCGISNAIVRSVFYCFDLPFLMTPLPAVVSLMLSEHRQTWGDRAAQTLVIRAGSICRTGTPARPSLSQ